MATQITPMLLAHTATTIAARNAGVSAPYRPGPVGVGVAVGAFGVDVADAGPGGQRAHHADDDEHGDRERVDPQQATQRDMLPRPDPEPEHRTAAEHRYRR